MGHFLGAVYLRGRHLRSDRTKATVEGWRRLHSRCVCGSGNSITAGVGAEVVLDESRSSFRSTYACSARGAPRVATLALWNSDGSSRRNRGNYHRRDRVEKDEVTENHNAAIVIVPPPNASHGLMRRIRRIQHALIASLMPPSHLGQRRAFTPASRRCWSRTCLALTPAPQSTGSPTCAPAADMTTWARG